MGAVVEPATAEHLPEIAVLAGMVWRAHYPGIISHEQIDYMLARMCAVEVMHRELSNGTAYDRLLVNEELRGFASYAPTRTVGEFKLHQLYIHPDAQRQGLGGLLLARVQNVARERGFEVLVLAVNKRNTNAITAYRKHGFTIRESVVVDIGDGFVMDDFVMVKTVDV
jgi:diamine N-acetyltransferase